MNELVLSLTIGPTPASAGIDRLSREPLTIGSSTSVISVLSVSPLLGDHEALDQLLHPSRWTIYRAQTIQSAVAILKQKRPPLLLCERDLGAGTRKENVEVQARLLELQTATAERVVATMVLDTNARVAVRSSAPVGVLSTSNRKPPLRDWSGHYPAGTNCQGFSMRIRRQ